MIITHCHALCGGCTFAYFTQVWQSVEWHYCSKQGNVCNLISANKQPPWNQCGSITVTGSSFSHFLCCSSSHFLFFFHIQLHCVFCLNAIQMSGSFLSPSKLVIYPESLNTSNSATCLYKNPWYKMPFLSLLVALLGLTNLCTDDKVICLHADMMSPYNEWLRSSPLSTESQLVVSSS